MSCCAPGAEAALLPWNEQNPSDEEIVLASAMVESQLLQTDLSVPSAHCGGCITAIEGALSQLDGVASARLNLSTRRATVKWKPGGSVPPLLKALSKAGYEASLFSHDETETDPELGRLVRATAVAGFAAANIMLLSVSIWAGADVATRNAFHYISAILALPTVAYSGRIFFLSAWAAIRSGRTNMDVPISVGIFLALVLSLHDTFGSGPHAYFDAVTTLIFFLLAGRTLDHLMRRKARTAILGLAKMMPRGAAVISPDGTRIYKPQVEIEPNEIIIVVPGDRIALDGTVESGTADIDASLVNGEATPAYVKPGSPVLSGMLNLNGLLTIRVTKAAGDSFVSDMIRMMEGAEQGQARYRRLADRAAAFYSPVVHTFAAMAFMGWMAATGDWHHALTVALSVLIITCPCALGLAVPMVQVMAARRLFERGIALKDGSALERLTEVDTVIFDKTGTLTIGALQVTECTVVGRDIDIALAIAGQSQHPVSRAIAALGPVQNSLDVQEFRELPGLGIEARIDGVRYRLGRPEWALGADGTEAAPDGTVLSRGSLAAGTFMFSDTLRPQARDTIAAIHARGLNTEVLSGDCRDAVTTIAASLGIANSMANLLPQDKIRRLEEITRDGHHVLMVGDGLNDAPALSAAYVSMAPASAADVGRASADLVFFGKGLMAVPLVLQIAQTARKLVHQNLVLAIAYNLLVIPIALGGLVTPLIAAVAMSLSSILVVANALRFPSASEPPLQLMPKQEPALARTLQALR